MALSGILISQGKLDDGRRLAEQALAGIRRRYGDEHLLTLAAMNNLASVVNQQGDDREAESSCARRWKLTAASEAAAIGPRSPTFGTLVLSWRTKADLTRPASSLKRPWRGAAATSSPTIPRR